MKKITLIVVSIFFMISSSKGQSMQIELKSRNVLEGVHSASGIEIYKNKYLIIGDNSKWLYELNKNLKLKNQFGILNTPDKTNDTIPKKMKPDFEASCIVGQHLYIFGSGSLSPTRDTLVKTELENLNEFRTFSLTSFYSVLQKELNAELNIEAALYYKEQIILLNRANNAMIIIHLVDFENFILEKTDKIEMQIIPFDLPVYKNVPANFSGACLIPNTNKILFTASLEATENWIDDGDVLGSYVGVIEFDAKDVPVLKSVMPIIENNEYCKVKAESIVVSKITKSIIKAVLVTDSDGGNSELIELDITGY